MVTLNKSTEIFTEKGWNGWHALRYFLFSLSKIYFQPSRVEGLKPALEESEEPSDSNKVDFNPLGLTGAEISALKVQKKGKKYRSECQPLRHCRTSKRKLRMTPQSLKSVTLSIEQVTEFLTLMLWNDALYRWKTLDQQFFIINSYLESLMD